MRNRIIEQLAPILESGDALLDTEKTAVAITETRQVLDISQKALSIEMKISQSYLCDLEQGKRRWSLEMFNAAKSAMERLSK